MRGDSVTDGPAWAQIALAAMAVLQIAALWTVAEQRG